MIPDLRWAMPKRYIEGILDAPSSCSAGQSGASVRVTWTDNSSGETGFQVWRSLTSGSGFTLLSTVAANLTIYTDSTVTISTTYYYKARAIRGDNASSFSNEDSSVVVDPIYLDTSVVSVAKGIYATRQVVDGYAGPGVKLVRDSDSAESDFSFTEGQDLDLAAITAWAAGTKRVVTWYDQSGLANHLTQSSNAARPIFDVTSPNTRDGRATITFTGFVSSPDHMTFASITTDPSSCSFYQISSARNEWAISPYLLRNIVFGMGTAPAYITHYFSNDATGPYMHTNGTSFVNKQRPMLPTDCAFSLIGFRSGTSAHGQLDDDPAVTNVDGLYDPGDCVGGNINANFNFAETGAADVRFLMILPYVDDSTHDEIKTTLQAMYEELPPTPTSNVWWFGDSLSAGYVGGVDFRWNSPMNRIAQSLPTSRCHCAGRAGWSILEIQQNADSWPLPVLAGLTAIPIAVVMGGYNNFAAAMSAADTHAQLITFCDLLTAAGFSVAVCLLPDSANYQASITAFNSLVSANYTTYADALIDLNSPDYTGERDADGIHFNEAGYAHLGTVALPTIQALIEA